MKHMIFVGKKWIALLLSFIMIVGSFPVNAIALELNTTIDTNSVINSHELIANNQEYSDSEEIGEVVEIVSLREENIKHFRLADGTYEAIVYTHPIHRKDKNGVWQDIDNNLTLDNDGTTQKYRTSDSRIKFTNSFKPNEEIFTLCENGYSITMTLISNDTSSKLSSTSELLLDAGAKPSVNNARKRTIEKAFRSLDAAASIDNRCSIVYDNVADNTAIEYVLQGNDIKENIIISAPRDVYDYQFKMNVIGLKAELDENGNIKLYDSRTGQSKYVIPAPYMYDANGDYSTDVSYDLNLIDEDAYLICICANEEWINSSDRAFPIIIDPSITSKELVWDAYTYSTYPNENYGYSEELWVSNYRTSYIYIEDIPHIPSGATLNYAYLYVSYYYHITDGGLLAGAYQILEDWDEETITYNNAPAVSTTRLDTDILTAASTITESSPGSARFLITNAVRNWYDNSATNCGIAIKRESSATYTNASVILKPYEAYDNDYAYISVNYTYYVPDGVYALRNDSSTTRWMTVEDDSVWAGAHIQQTYSSTSPASTSVFDRSSLFKISRINGTSLYIIRSMLNNNLSFGLSGTEIITKEIPSADSDVGYADTFYIEWTGDGFVIRPNGSSDVIKMASTSTTNLTTVAKTNATSSARWHLVQYTGVHKRGSSIYRPVTLNVGTTVTMTPVIWSTNIDYNTPNLSVTPGYTSKATSTWDESTRKATFVLHDDGTLSVTLKIYNGAQSSSYSFTHTVTLTLVVNEGIYFFKNKEVGKYMQIDDDNELGYNASGAKMELRDFDNGDYQKWQLVHIKDGYYEVLSVQSGLAVCVKSDSINKNEKPLVQEEYSDLNRKKWKITKSSSGAYILRPKSGESYDTDWCMCAGDQFLGFADGFNVEQKAYVNNNNYKDEWILQSINCSLPTPLIGQQTSMWCWAASAEMLARTKYPTAANNGNQNTIIREQRDAVYHVFGDTTSTSSTYNWEQDPQGLNSTGGVYFDVANAAAFLVGEVSGEETFSGYATPYSEADLIHFLLDGHAVARLYGWASINWTPPTTIDEFIEALSNLDPNVGGHVTVIVGVTWSSTEQCYIYTVNDPANGGSQIQYTYMDLLFNIDNSDGKSEIYFWFPTVVSKTDYSRKTLIENIVGKDYSSD